MPRISCFNHVVRNHDQRVLVCGWFSFPGAPATAGDLLARDHVVEWLRAAAVPHDVLVTPPFEGGVPLHQIEPGDYTDVVVVCGPYIDGCAVTELMRRMPQARRHGIDLSVMGPVDRLSLQFHHLFERDSDRAARPDLTFVTDAKKVPVVGRILVHPQPEYGDRARHDEANHAIHDLLRRHEAAVVQIDTQLNVLRTPCEVESLIAKMDVVVTTRLHGTVLALKHHVPVLAIDPIAGGAKIAAQARLIEWPILFTADDLNAAHLDHAFAYCQTPEAVRKAAECAARAAELLAPLHHDFMTALLPSLQR